MVNVLLWNLLERVAAHRARVTLNIDLIANLLDMINMIDTIDDHHLVDMMIVMIRHPIIVVIMAVRPTRHIHHTQHRHCRHCRMVVVMAIDMMIQRGMNDVRPEVALYLVLVDVTTVVKMMDTGHVIVKKAALLTNVINVVKLVIKREHVQKVVVDHVMIAVVHVHGHANTNQIVIDRVVRVVLLVMVMLQQMLHYQHPHRLQQRIPPPIMVALVWKHHHRHHQRMMKVVDHDHLVTMMIRKMMHVTRSVRHFHHC